MGEQGNLANSVPSVWDAGAEGGRQGGTEDRRREDPRSDDYFKGGQGGLFRQTTGVLPRQAGTVACGGWP